MVTLIWNYSPSHADAEFQPERQGRDWPYDFHKISFHFIFSYSVVFQRSSLRVSCNKTALYGNLTLKERETSYKWNYLDESTASFSLSGTLYSIVV